MNLDGSSSRSTPIANRNSFGWSTKPSYTPSALPQSTNTVSLSLATMIKQSNWMPRTTTNTFWQDAEQMELFAILGYNTFDSKGRHAPAPVGFKKIQVHFVYAVKHDGRHKARLVAGGGTLRKLPLTVSTPVSHPFEASE